MSPGTLKRPRSASFPPRGRLTGEGDNDLRCPVQRTPDLLPGVGTLSELNPVSEEGPGLTPEDLGQEALGQHPEWGPHRAEAAGAPAPSAGRAGGLGGGVFLRKKPELGRRRPEPLVQAARGDRRPEDPGPERGRPPTSHLPRRS